MHITSLPGEFGCGTMGAEANDFIRYLAEAGFSAWQILPLCPPGPGHSPYSSIGSFAGATHLIDPRLLVTDGLLSEADLPALRYSGKSNLTDYTFAEANTETFLRRAFLAARPSTREAVTRYAEAQGKWLYDYALFTVISDRFQGKDWRDWPDAGLRAYDFTAVATFAEQHRDQVEFVYFSQWLFSRQWQSLRTTANENGISLIGDLPFYVAANSADVWGNRELFELNADYTTARVAGVPPDYFSAAGQLWGNPLYLWPKHREDGYAWWLERIARQLDLVDVLRLDHFRAFSTYWACPGNATNARDGVWEQGPGMDLLVKIIAEYGRERFIAEDLGLAADDVAALLRESELPGIKVLQFGLSPGSSPADRPHFIPRNSVVYTGTHDNNTLLGWLWEAPEHERRDALAYIGFPEDGPWGVGGKAAPACLAYIRLLFQSQAERVIIPIQDLCGYGADTRMNIPGTPVGNWAFRLRPEALRDDIDWQLFRQMNEIYDRLPEIV